MILWAWIWRAVSLYHGTGGPVRLQWKWMVLESLNGTSLVEWRFALILLNKKQEEDRMLVLWQALSPSGKLRHSLADLMVTYLPSANEGPMGRSTRRHTALKSAARHTLWIEFCVLLDILSFVLYILTTLCSFSHWILSNRKSQTPSLLVKCLRLGWELRAWNSTLRLDTLDTELLRTSYTV